MIIIIRGRKRSGPIRKEPLIPSVMTDICCALEVWLLYFNPSMPKSNQTADICRTSRKEHRSYMLVQIRLCDRSGKISGITDGRLFVSKVGAADNRAGSQSHRDFQSGANSNKGNAYGTYCCPGGAGT